MQDLHGYYHIRNTLTLVDPTPDEHLHHRLFLRLAEPAYLLISTRCFPKIAVDALSLGRIGVQLPIAFPWT
jgi:hypothetical protein